MAKEPITTTQVLQGLHGLTGRMDSAFQAITDLADHTATGLTTATNTIAQPPTSSLSKKTAKASEEYDGDLEGGHTFIKELYLYLYGETFDEEKKITIALSFLSKGDTTKQ